MSEIDSSPSQEICRDMGGRYFALIDYEAGRFVGLSTRLELFWLMCLERHGWADIWKPARSMTDIVDVDWLELDIYDMPDYLAKYPHTEPR